MTKAVRLLLTLTVLVFATGTVAQGTAAARMEVGMSVMSPAVVAETMPDCGDCSGDTNAMTVCLLACGFPALGLSHPTIAPGPTTSVGHAPASLRVMEGAARAPDPQPPRTSS